MGRAKTEQTYGAEWLEISMFVGCVAHAFAFSSRPGVARPFSSLCARHSPFYLCFGADISLVPLVDQLQRRGASRVTAILSFTAVVALLALVLVWYR